MRYTLTGIAFVLMCTCGVSLAQTPPFREVVIMGVAKTVYNRVSLLKNGRSRVPFKTENVSESYGTYSIAVNIPDEMERKDNYFYTDFRFWNDKNNNGKIDSGEPYSKCHFVIWVPAKNIVYLEVYKGKSYIFKSSSITYDPR